MLHNAGDANLSIMTPGAGGMGYMGGGDVGGRLLANGMNVNVLRPFVGSDGRSYITNIGPDGKPQVQLTANNATLRYQEWQQIDQAVIAAAMLRLIGVADLYSRNLVYRVSNGLGTTVLVTETMSDTEQAQVSMDGATRGRRDRPEFGVGYLPLPIAHKDFQIDIRTLNASRNRGQALDTLQAENAGRKVAEKIESILFNGLSSYNFGGGTLYGYTDYPYRNTQALTYAWDNASATGATMLTDVLAMTQKSVNARHYGPWVLYIPAKYQTVIGNDFKQYSDKSIRERLLEVSGLTDIKVADFLTGDNIMLVEMSTDTVRAVEGLQIQTLEWASEGGMILNYKVMAIIVPQLRADIEGRCGITHGSI